MRVPFWLLVDGLLELLPRIVPKAVELCPEKVLLLLAPGALAAALLVLLEVCSYAVVHTVALARSDRL